MTGFKVPREEVRDAPVNAYMEYGPKSVVRGIKNLSVNNNRLPPTNQSGS
jgi:hypothetical protein